MQRICVFVSVIEVNIQTVRNVAMSQVSPDLLVLLHPLTADTDGREHHVEFQTLTAIRKNISLPKSLVPKLR